MKSFPLNLLDKATEDLEPEMVKLGYSGRGMNGETCVGIVATVHELVDVFVALARDEDADELTDVMRNALRSDDYGRETIWYFPGIEFIDEEPDEDLDDSDHAYEALVDAQLGVD